MTKTFRSFKMNRMRILSGALLAVAISVISVGVALAHERRSVGKYDFVVGFLNEPAYVNQVNSVDFRVTNHDTTKPVEGLDKTVKVEVVIGPKTLPLSLSARFGQPGAYNAYFLPTKVGSVVFHFTGDIEGQKIDEKFESGPGRFGDVEDTIPMQFPDKLADPAALGAQIQAAQNTAASAQTIAYVGIALGVIGIVVGALGWMKKK